jgi:hypothetical protein
MRSLVFLCFILLLTSGSTELHGQACCSGGVPISSNLGLGSLEKGSLQFQLTYDWNHLNDLFSQRRRLHDDNRVRNTHSFLLETSYDISSAFSVSALFSVVRQERIITTFANPDITSNTGLGDAIFLLRYNLFHKRPKSPHQLIIGVGPKIPLGRTDYRDERGIVLPADLQPGTGAWDAMFWGFYRYTGIIRPSTTLFGLSTYRFTGTNPVYNGSQAYQFGPEYQVQAGMSDRLFVGPFLLDPSLLMRYRTVNPDKIEGNTFPNTGGHWWFVTPGLQLALQPQTTLRASVDLPVFQSLQGTQLTTTRKITVAFYHILGGKGKALEGMLPGE